MILILKGVIDQTIISMIKSLINNCVVLTLEKCKNIITKLKIYSQKNIILIGKNTEYIKKIYKNSKILLVSNTYKIPDNVLYDIVIFNTASNDVINLKCRMKYLLSTLDWI